MNVRPLALLPLLAGGCLARDISNTIDGLQCGAAPDSDTHSGGTTDCPNTSEGDDTAGASTHGVHTSTVDHDSMSEADASDTTSESDTTTASSGTTGEPTAVCGNGIVEAFGPAPEDCDDGNDIEDDGCRDCGRDRLVFITSQSYQGGIFDEGGVPSGMAGADQRCQSLAALAKLPNYFHFKPWLSDSQVSARDRMFAGRGRYVLVNGLVVANSWQALLAGELQNPINVTELSETKISDAYTGTNPDGTAAAGSDFCADWSENTVGNAAHWGISSEVTADWTIADAPVDQPGDCGAERALYCFEQE